MPKHSTWTQEDTHDPSTQDAPVLRLMGVSAYFRVKGKQGRGGVRALDDVWVGIKPGITAMMGPSGAGKTSLLNVMAGRTENQDLFGDMYYHDVRAGTAAAGRWMEHNSGMVTQLGKPWNPDMTVRENLIYSAELRLAGRLSREDTLERVRETMDALSMWRFADTKVGSDLSGGISGGQKRLLATAVQLLSDPQVLFLDEPTSGLDALTSLKLLEHLRSVAASGRVVVITIHQPRVEVWQMFDDLIILAQGKVAYQGSPAEAEMHFGTLFLADPALDATRPADELVGNPADAVLDVLSNVQKQTEACEIYAHGIRHKKDRSGLAGFMLALRQKCPPSEADATGESAAGASLWATVWVGMIKLFVANRRLLKTTLSTFLEHFVYCIVIVTIVGMLNYDHQTGLGYVNGIVLIATANYICTLNIRHTVLVTQRNAIEAEVVDGVFSLWQFAVTAIPFQLGKIAISACISCSVGISLIGWTPVTPEEFFAATASIMLYEVVLDCIFLALLLNINYAQESGLAIRYSIFTILGMSFYSGPLIPYDQTARTVGTWVLEICPTFQLMKILTSTLLEGRMFPCDSESKLTDCGKFDTTATLRSPAL